MAQLLAIVPREPKLCGGQSTLYMHIIMSYLNVCLTNNYKFADDLVQALR